MAHRVWLVHWDEDEGLERRRQLEASGFDARFEFGDSLAVARRIKAGSPEAVVIDLSRVPSSGRHVAHSIRQTKSTRHVPLVFVGGEPDKIARTREFLPDATFTTWGRITAAVARAIKTPVKNPVVPGESYSTPVPAKLGVKPGFKVALLGSPKGFAGTLTPLPAKVRFTARPERDADLYICFARTERELQAHLLAVSGAADRQTLWLSWPKKASGITSDLDGNVVRETGLRAGWVDFKVCAIDATWSGLAFKRRR